MSEQCEIILSWYNFSQKVFKRTFFLSIQCLGLKCLICIIRLSEILKGVICGSLGLGGLLVSNRLTEDTRLYVFKQQEQEMRLCCL